MEQVNKGDLQIRVHVIEGRSLKGRDMNGMSDPICLVRVNDQTKKTTCIKNTTSPFWDQTFFFQFQYLPEEMSKTKINLCVYDANTIFRNVVIGSFEFDAELVHNQPNHEYFRKWVALIDHTVCLLSNKSNIL